MTGIVADQRPAGRSPLTLWLFAAMIVGAAAGWAMHGTLDAPHRATVVDGLGMVTDSFLRLIKMIVAPLVLATLTVGLARMEGAAAIGRIGAKTMIWFLAASVISLSIGLSAVHLIRPGADLALTLPSAGAGWTDAAVQSVGLKAFLSHLIPVSIVDAMARNEILQIVLFASFAGTAMAALGREAELVLRLADQIVTIMLKVTAYVMGLAPIAVLAAVASTVTAQGIGVLATYARFVGGFYGALAVLWLLFAGVAFLLVGRRTAALFAAIREPALIAFTTASSEAAYPKTLERLEAFGASRRIVSFVLPLGYSFNLDGSMMYCAFAVLFVAQAYGIDLSLATQASLFLLLMLASKGMAGVPRASLVVVAAALPQIGLPAAGMLLILSVDHLLDMGRTATNVIGNSVAAIAIARWEGQLQPAGISPESIITH